MEWYRKLHGPRLAVLGLTLAAVGAAGVVLGPVSGVWADPSAPAASSGHQVAAKDAHDGAAAGAKDEAKSGGAVHWGYSGQGGPQNWGRLSKDYHLCMLGTEQSPIDIGAVPFDGATVAPIAFDYRLSPVEILNNGHTIQVNYAPGSAITVRGKRFELLQFHFHTPSEHAIEGR